MTAFLEHSLMAHNPDLSVVIPVYRSSETLPELVRRLVAVLSCVGVEYELVLVDDGSPDHSWSVLEKLQEEYPNLLRPIQLMRNYGQHNALMCGFRHARGEFVVTMDDDLQNPPEEIPKLLAAIQERDLDLVYGCYQTKRHVRWRNVGSTIVNAFFRLVFRVPIRVTSFRVMRRSLVESISRYDLNFTFVDGLLAWNTQRIGSVPVAHHPRRRGRSGYSIAKLLLLAINLFTNFSLLPLQVISAIGLATAALGLGCGCYYLALSLLSQISVPGYASLMVAVLTLGGLQLLSLGVMGEYLGRLHLNVNRKPQYTVRRRLGGENPHRASRALRRREAVPHAWSR
jgi:undecaprenyl-phosphate 4-deoxy-4-formamido-L-arabinose transferase